MNRTLIALMLLAACKAPATQTTDVDADTDADTDTDTDADTDTDTDTDDTDTDTDTDVEDTDVEPPLVVDCSTLPSPGLTYTRMTAPRGYHGLAFDQIGNLVGWDGTSVLRATSPDISELWVPSVNQVEQMDYLPNGDLASTGNGNIVTVAPNGAGTVLASGINAYGLEVGPDGFIYTANQQVVHRVDPVNGGATVVVPGNQVDTPKVLNFSPDGTLMYVGTNSNNGEVWEIDLDANFNPIFPARLLANTGGSWHDGLGVDACGNLYVAEFFTRSLYLITPAGAVSTLIDYNTLGNGAYGHGIQWGEGIGAWSDHNIYVPLPYDSDHVAEVELGIPARDYNDGNYVTVP